MLSILESITINGYPLIYVPWNVFLAMVPVIISYYLYKKFFKKVYSKIGFKEKLVFIILFIIWIFFFPNTAYLFTEVRYLVNYCLEVTKLRVCPNQTFIPPIFLMYSLIGVPTFIYSLKIMSELLKRFINELIGKVFSLVMIIASGFGVMLGLVERVNSWEVFLHPYKIVKTGIGYLFITNILLGIVAYIVLMCLIYYGSLKILEKLKKPA